MSKDNYLEAKELVFIVIGCTIGPGFLKLPHDLVKVSGQDAWISAIIALSYPLYLVLLSLYIINKAPNNNLLEISRNLFGTILGNIFNLIFFSQFILVSATVTSDFILLMGIYITPFLSPLKISLFCIALCTYAASRGLKVLSSVSELVLYMIIFSLILSLYALRESSIKNVMPILNTDYKLLLKSSVKCIYYYSGFEVITLFHPYVSDKEKIKKYLLLSILISGIIWSWTVFITIYYLGIYLTPKITWSFILVYESIKFPIINNFRYIFMFLWIFVSLRIISNYLFVSSQIISNITKIKSKYTFYLIIPIVIYMSIKFSNMSQHSIILNTITPITIYYNCLFILLVAIFISFKFNRKFQLK